MKRSAKVCLLLMAALASPACATDDKPDVQAFSSLENCVSAGNSESQCKQWQEAALKEQPRFASKEQCEEKFGVDSCQSHHGGFGGGFFAPALLGFMAGHALSGGASGLFGNPAQPTDARLANGAQAPARFGQGASSAGSGRMGRGVNLGNTGVSRGGFTGGGRSSFSG